MILDSSFNNNRVKVAPEERRDIIRLLFIWTGKINSGTRNRYQPSVSPSLFIAVISGDEKSRSADVSIGRFSEFFSTLFSSLTWYFARNSGVSVELYARTILRHKRGGCWKSGTPRAKAALAFPRHCKSRLNRRETGGNGNKIEAGIQLCGSIALERSRNERALDVDRSLDFKLYLREASVSRVTLKITNESCNNCYRNFSSIISTHVIAIDTIITVINSASATNNKSALQRYI